MRPVFTSLLLAIFLSACAAPTPVPETPIDTAVAAAVQVKGAPDWLEIGFGSVWVSNRPYQRVERIDIATRQVVGAVAVPSPCALAIGFDSVWVVGCGGTLHRINPQTSEVMATIPVKLADAETGIAAAEGGVWVVSQPGVLLRIDPATNSVTAQTTVKPYSVAAAAGFGAVWVTNTGKPDVDKKGSVQRVDPATNTVVADIPVGGQPRFLAAGEAGVWVLNQTDGSVSRIDPSTNKVVATITAGVPGSGGDIAAGEGAVWVRHGATLLTVIDPKTNKIVKRYGPSQGSGAVRARDGSVWLSAHDVQTAWCLEPGR